MVRYMDMLTSNLHSYIFYGRKSMAFRVPRGLALVASLRYLAA